LFSFEPLKAKLNPDNNPDINFSLTVEYFKSLGQTWNLLVFVYFLFLKRRLGPLGYYAPPPKKITTIFVYLFVLNTTQCAFLSNCLSNDVLFVYSIFPFFTHFFHAKTFYFTLCLCFLLFCSSLNLYFSENVFIRHIRLSVRTPFLRCLLNSKNNNNNNNPNSKNNNNNITVAAYTILNQPTTVQMPAFPKCYRGLFDVVEI